MAVSTRSKKQDGNDERNIIIRNIPNALTSVTVFCGFAQMVGDLFPWYDVYVGGLLIYIGLVTDILDGFAARLLDVKSPIGANFDQLADLVCFGIGPPLLFARTISSKKHDETTVMWMLVCSFLYVLSGVYRIAREITSLKGAKPTTFIGIPTNLAAFVMVPLIATMPGEAYLTVPMVFLSFMMCSTYPVPKGMWIIDIK